LCRLLYRDVFRLNPKSDHADALQRWWILQHGNEPQSNETIQ